MICKRCNVLMDITGTTYEKRKNNSGKDQLIHKRYEKCPKCNMKKYNSSSNFQETLKATVIKQYK